VGRMTGADRLKRTIDACRRAGLPVIEAKQCTCTLRGRLVVLDGPDGLRVLWPTTAAAACTIRETAKDLRLRVDHGRAGRDRWPHGRRGLSERQAPNERSDH
jgi:hypothetical protein